MHKVKCNQHIITVLNIPGDGNCLFSALVHQMSRENPGTAQHKKEIEELRFEVANHIGKNPQQYQDQINSNLNELNSFYAKPDIRTGTTDKIMEYYCDKIRTPGFWGGAESILAVTQLYQVNIDIYMEEGDLISFNTQERKESKRLNIAYRKGTNGYNHYDSIIDIQQLKGNPATKKTNTHQNTKLASQVNIENISIAQNIGFEVQMNDEINYRTKKSSANIKIATWNVRGCTLPQKKNDIDETLNDNGIDLAALQETHTNAGKVETKNFIWWTASGNTGREYRGVAILINKASKIDLVSIKTSSESICSAKIQWENNNIIVIAAHIYSENDARYKDQLSDLNRIVTQIHKNYPILILGDLNAHFGKEDKSPEDTQWIGGRIRHQKTNEIGRYLKTLMHIHQMTLHNSWSQRNTVLTTWTNGHSSSQIDHIISTLNRDAISYINAKWTHQVKTDHKLLYGVILKDKISLDQSKPRKPQKRKQWHINALNSTETKDIYAAEILIALEEMNLKTSHPTTINEDWGEIKDAVIDAASTILTEPRSPMTPKRRKIIANINKARFLRERYPDKEEIRIDLKNMNKERKDLESQHFTNKCAKFINNLKHLHPHQRLKELYSLIKRHKQSQQKKPTYISINKWKEIIHKEIGQTTEEIKETDNKNLPPPPSIHFLNHWIKTGNRGKAPGADNINLELLQNAPPKLISEIARIMGKAWENNSIPTEWLKSIQVPIPKTKNPKTTDNYRRISLCSILYKLYAKYILQCLEKILPETPSYQAAFLPMRATDDHLFTAGRVLEERWRGGKITYIVSLDLEKAFDTISHQAIIATLKHQNVPHKIINRIIKTCLNENTKIQWYGQRTQEVHRGIGVKQGCPLSPRLFNEVMNEVLQTAAELLPYLKLEQQDHLSLPMILVFADDILILSDTEKTIQELINELIPLFASAGLKINIEKSKILIRDPNQVTPPTSNISINNRKLDLVNNLKYLGIFLTNTLNRRKNIKEKIKRAYMTAHSIFPFLNKHHLPWKLTKAIYELSIVPIVTYGLKTTVLTKDNRIKLRDMERDIVKLLSATCKPKVKSTNTNVLLEKKTIIRKIALLRIRYWGHICRRPNSHMLQTAYKLREKKRKIGRPCYTWNTCLEKDKKKYKIQETAWPTILSNRKDTTIASKEIFLTHDSSDSEESMEIKKEGK